MLQEVDVRKVGAEGRVLQPREVAQPAPLCVKARGARVVVAIGVGRVAGRARQSEQHRGDDRHQGQRG